MFRVELKKKAYKFLEKLDEQTQIRITKKLRGLGKNPKIGKPLIGNLTGLWSLRIGKYRALYEIKETELVIYVLAIGHRKNIY